MTQFSRCPERLPDQTQQIADKKGKETRPQWSSGKKTANDLALAEVRMLAKGQVGGVRRLVVLLTMRLKTDDRKGGELGASAEIVRRIATLL